MKTLAEKIAVMQAAANGAKVRRTFKHSSVTPQAVFYHPSPMADDWNWVDFDYEVVPGPEVIYVNKTKDGHSYVHPNNDYAVAAAGVYYEAGVGAGAGYEYIAKKFIEEKC